MRASSAAATPGSLPICNGSLLVLGCALLHGRRAATQHDALAVRSACRTD